MMACTEVLECGIIIRLYSMIYDQTVLAVKKILLFVFCLFFNVNFKVY